MYKKITAPLIGVFFFFSLAAAGKAPDPIQQVKDYLNEGIQTVIAEETPSDKRAVLNNTLDSFILATTTALERPGNPEEVTASLNYLKAHFEEKKDELNGKNGFVLIADNQLDNFALFVQQDTEQAYLELDESFLWVVGILILSALVVYGAVLLAEESY